MPPGPPLARKVILILLQNAMNAAEITDKLGLHSLRQRAWVCLNRNSCIAALLTYY